MRFHYAPGSAHPRLRGEHRQQRQPRCLLPGSSPSTRGAQPGEAVAGVEPSIQQRERLRRTIDDLAVPALYTERGSMNRTPVLQQVGKEAGVRVCELYSDSLDADAPSYSQMMLANAQAITDCST